MASQPQIDPAQCVKLHKQGLSVKIIAHRIGCRPPAVYRAFRRVGYSTWGMKRRDIGAPANYPPEAKAREYGPTENWRSDMDAEEAAIAARRIPPRDPCPRCGVRGDIGCGCVKQPLGWRAG